MKEKNKKLSVAALIVMTSIVASRLTGFVREMLVPNLLGVNEVADAYNLAFKVTGLMYDLLVGGAIAAALIPILSGYIAKKDEEDGWRAVSTFINVTIIAMTIVCIMGIIFSPQIVSIIAVGFKSEYQRNLTIELTRILFPSVAFLMLSGLLNGILNSYQRFAAASYGPTIYNFGCVLSLYFFANKGVKTVAYGIMASSFIYFLFQLIFTIKNLKFYRPFLYIKHPGFIKIVTLAIPSLISSSIVQINVIISGSFATLFKAGSVTAFNMADRTWQMPYGIFAQGMGIAMLPTLSASLAVGKIDEYKNTLMKGLKAVLFLTIPSAIGFIVLKEPIIRTIFKFTNKFDDSAVMVAGNVLMLFSFALLSQSIVTILNRAFYANNDTKTPLYIGISTILINFGLSFIFYKFTSLDVSGMALSYSITSIINACLLLIILNKKMKGIHLDNFLKFLFKSISAALIMGIVIYLINYILPVNISSKLFQFLILSALVGVGVLVYLILTLFMGIDEAKIFKNKIFSKFKS